MSEIKIDEFWKRQEIHERNAIVIKTVAKKKKGRKAWDKKQENEAKNT